MSEKEYPPLVMPAGVEREAITIWSNGRALDGDVYRPVDRAVDDLLPGVVLGHGWGGSKVTAERYAALFASAGMITVTLTQPTWFGSEPALQLVGDLPELDDQREGMARVRVTRDLVDPYAWVDGIRSALDYLEGEPGVDVDRLGLWSTSFGGAVAVYHCGHDARVKALVVQVPAIAGLAGPAGALARQRAIQTARGDIPAIPQGIDPFPSMDGTPFMAHRAHFDPMAQAERLGGVPTLIIDAAEDELVPIQDNGATAAAIIRGLPDGFVDYRVIAGIDHYGIYFDGYAEGSQAALDWWKSHL